MRSVIISASLFVILSVIIIFNAYYINSISTELLDIVFSLPSEYEYIKDLDTSELERFKTEINKIVNTWEKNAFRISLVTKYQDFERINLAVYSLREYFFSGYYEHYVISRNNLIIALEKQKQNEMANLDNIL